MRKNVSSQMIGAQMSSVLSGTDYTNSGAVLARLTMSGSGQVLGAVNSGICVPRSFGWHFYIAAQSETNFDHIAFTFVASGAISVTNQVYTERIGTPIGVDLATDVQSIQTGVNSLYARVGAPVGTNLATDVNSVQVGVNSIYARVGTPVGTDLATDVKSVQSGVTSLTALIAGGRMTADVSAVNSDVNAASNLRRGVLGNVVGNTVGDSTTSTLSTANLSPAAAIADQFVSRVLTFDRDTVTAALRGQGAIVSSMTAAGVLFVTSLTTAPPSGNTFAIT